ncbi:oxygenase MpaB family protein [Amycolatopsis kentuckyensis]|uniref:oxygenase MpaB family protein n=1 Tax=Amycolatopsis kentuckyensis TaxID=218823 RepID=UPI003568646D
MAPTPPVVTALRERARDALFARIAGPDGPRNRARIHGAPGPRWFAPGSAIQQVHGDTAMFVGGLRALLLQSLHPLAMAAVAAHSGYRGDPWGRLQRTSTFLATTTFGTADDAGRAVSAVRAVHQRVRGVAPDGRSYRADDPHLLAWVHIAEVDSFLRAHQRYGAHPLDDAGRDRYVAETAVIARALGVPDPPVTVAALEAELATYRPELHGTRDARLAARFLLVTPPIPWPARLPYAALAASAVAMLPGWARPELRLPHLPVAEATLVRVAGTSLVKAVRWVMAAPAPSAAA